MFPDIFSLVIGAILSITLCELIVRLCGIKRFAFTYTISFMIFLIIIPFITRIYAFPYTGALSGMQGIGVAVSSFWGMLFYVGTWCVCVMTDTERKRRFIYCIIAFYLLAALSLYYMNSAALRPIIA